MTPCLLPHAHVQWAALLVAGGLGCASTQVTTTSETGIRPPKPERVVVHRFASSPDQVRLDHSVIADPIACVAAP
jgi:hypothetical protein